MKQETYEELTELHGCDWFNTNPIHVLRSQYSIDDNVEPLVYYEIGKQYQLGYGIWEEMASRVESDVHSKLLMAPTWVAGTREDVEESVGEYTPRSEEYTPRSENVEAEEESAGEEKE